jgi:hypothetical protein
MPYRYRGGVRRGTVARDLLISPPAPCSGHDQPRCGQFSICVFEQETSRLKQVKLMGQLLTSGCCYMPVSMRASAGSRLLIRRFSKTAPRLFLSRVQLIWTRSCTRIASAYCPSHDEQLRRDRCRICLAALRRRLNVRSIHNIRCKP